MKKTGFIVSLLAGLALTVMLVLGLEYLQILQPNESKQVTDESKVETRSQTARIMANGDLLYHDILYMSALQEDGRYSFDENFSYAREWLEQADLAIGDFEGTISSDYSLSGYPLFNAPLSVTEAVKNAGYDVVDLAHNHILDSHLSGLFSTVDAFHQVGIDTVGVYTEPIRSEAPLYIRDLNGIKVAIFAYAYGFNGMEGSLETQDYENHLSDLNDTTNA